MLLEKAEQGEFRFLTVNKK